MKWASLRLSSLAINLFSVLVPFSSLSYLEVSMPESMFLDDEYNGAKSTWLIRISYKLISPKILVPSLAFIKEGSRNEILFFSFPSIILN